MTNRQDILRRIAALRARLAKGHGLLEEADGTAGGYVHPDGSDRHPDPQAAEGLVAEVAGRIAKSEREASLIDAAMRPLAEEELTLPPRLTARAMRLLHQGRNLLVMLRQLAGHKAIRGSEMTPRSRLHRETLAMLETVLRTVQAFPPAPSAQLRLCEGLEAVLEVVAERIKILDVACQHAVAE